MLAMRLKDVARRVLPAPAQKLIKRMIRAWRNRNSVPYYDPADFPYVATLEANWLVIRKELESLEEQNLLGDWPGPTPHRGRWYGYALFGAGMRHEENCARCPETMRILATIPHLETATFLGLTPGSKVLPHVDLSRTTMRCSLTLKSPDECKIRVAREVRGWPEGKCMLFDPNFEHEVWNDGATPRIVLQLGVTKPGMVHDARDQKNFEKMAETLLP